MILRLWGLFVSNFKVVPMQMFQGTSMRSQARIRFFESLLRGFRSTPTSGKKKLQWRKSSLTQKHTIPYWANPCFTHIGAASQFKSCCELNALLIIFLNRCEALILHIPFLIHPNSESFPSNLISLNRACCTDDWDDPDPICTLPKKERDSY